MSIHSDETGENKDTIALNEQAFEKFNLKPYIDAPANAELRTFN